MINIPTPSNIYFNRLLPFLESLRKDTETVCKSAYSQRSKIDDAINWGDLHCCGAEFYINTEGDWGLRVLIEEAAPEANKLQEYIANKLKAMGYEGITVETEW